MQYLVSGVPIGAGVIRVRPSLAADTGEAAAIRLRARTHFLGAMSFLLGGNAGIPFLAFPSAGRDSSPGWRRGEFAALLAEFLAHFGHAGFGGGGVGAGPSTTLGWSPSPAKAGEDFPAAGKETAL
jgi:hypothetical protein